MTALSASDLAGRRIRHLRNGKGWTGKDLAEKCAKAGMPEITRPVITDLETRRRASRRITADELLVLAHILGVEPLDLLLPAAGEMLQVTPGVVMDIGEAEEFMHGRPCLTCRGEPPAGFTCNTCGRSGS